MVRNYYDLENGFYIAYPNELLKIANNPTVWISRKALKHFVERRKSELKGREIEEVLFKLYFAIEYAEIVIQKHDNLLKDDFKTIFSKFFIELDVSIRIVVEDFDDRKEIKSIHFQKYKKAINNDDF